MVDDMNVKLKDVIKNATETALKIDGYNQAIILENDGTYAFTRNYKDCCPEWLGKIIGEVVTYWDRGILKAKYVSR